ncbi:MAG TPA: T9SS type A sorting domain-containing protein [Bacteroidales bacterium]|nr:T9SS type A sorting domain-containing protein [Bacteroidales bacterium]
MAVLLPGKSLDAHHGPGIIIDSPENEEITAMFEDPAGNKIFLCKQGSHPAPCNMLILRFSPSGLLNLQSVLAIPDTSVILYAGFGTPEGQYVFTGVIREPVITNYPAYCMLVSVVTDPSFNVTAIRRYPIGPEYCMIDGMYVCSHDAFALTVACNTGDFAGSNHYNDLVIRRFNASGELILEKNFHFAWPQKVVAVVHPGGSSQHCLLAEGFSDQSFLHLLYLDPDWNIQDIFPLLPGDFFNDPLSARWIDSLSMMIICEHNVSIIDSDIRCMHVSGDGTIMNFFDLVSPDKIDWPATDRGIHAVYDSSFTFLGAGNSFPFSYISTISVTRMTTGLQTVWTKTYSDIENYFIVGAFPLAGGSLLTAASFTVPGVSPYQRGLIFFRLDEQGEWMSLEEPEEDAAAPFEVYPNPGGDQLNISCAIPGPWSVSVISSDGRLCRESNSMVSAGILSMEGLPSGLYTLCFTKQQSRLYKKWIKR